MCMNNYFDACRCASQSVSSFLRPQALTNEGTITFVLTNIICDTPLELFLSPFAVLLESQHADGK